MKGILRRLVIRKSTEPSVHQLRCHLMDIVEETRDRRYVAWADGDYDSPRSRGKLAGLNSLVESARESIQLMDRHALCAVIRASKNTEYNVLSALMSKDSDLIRDYASYFGMLVDMGVQEKLFNYYLDKMTRLTGLADLSSAYRKSPLGAKTLLSLIIDKVEGNGRGQMMYPEMVKLILAEPYWAGEIADFIDQRKITLMELDAPVFLEAMDTETRSLRDGIL